MNWLKKIFRSETHIHNHYHNNPVAVNFNGGVLHFGHDEKITFIKYDFNADQIMFVRVK